MDLVQPFLIGLFGSLHCAGMCGPVALSLPLKEDSPRTKIASSLLYNSGRVLTYALLGLIFGLAGLGISIWGIQQWVSIAAGTLMIVGVAFPVIFNKGAVAEGMDSIFCGFKKIFGRFLGLRSYSSVLAIGLLNGFLPCGLVYIALAGALISTTPAEGALHMVAFGAGTIPALLAISILGNRFIRFFRGSVRKVIPLLIVLIGILFILRGMNLGIQYVSPKMDQQHHQDKTEVLQKPDCCH